MEDLRWFLVSHGVGPAGRVEHQLQEGENLVGRKRDAKVHLAHLDVSREHCLVFLTNSSNTLVLIDKGSRNGTFVNGHKVCAEKAVTLFENDSVGFGSNTNAQETYADKMPFLVYRVVKKIPSNVFEEIVLRGKGITKRAAETAPSCVPAIKRIKAEHGIAPAPAPVVPRSRQSTEVSSTVPSEEPQPQPANVDQVSSRGMQVTRSRPDGLDEVFVIDDDDVNPAPVAKSSSVINQSESSKCDDRTTTQTSLLAKSIDSTIQNGLTSDVEAGTPSFQNSSSRTNDDTRSIQKNRSREISNADSSSKKARREPSPPRPSTSKTALFKQPLMLKKERISPPPSPVPDSPSLNSSKNGDIPTFSLISDDESEDELTSSQMFFRTEDTPQTHVRPPETSDDDVYEVFDSDEESMFENHLSQSFSQSFMLADEVDALIEVEDIKKPPVDSELKDEAIKKPVKLEIGKRESGSRARKPSLDTSKKSKQPSKAKNSDVPPRRSRNSSKDTLRPRSSEPAQESTVSSSDKVKVSKEPPKMSRAKAPTMRTKDPAKVSVVPETAASSSKEQKVSIESSKVESEVDKIVQKIIDDSKVKITTRIPKKTKLVEPHSLPSKGDKSTKPVAKLNQAVLPAKRRVTFKEDLTEVRVFECQGTMKKLSSVPTHFLKEHPPKQPALQWNPLLLRSCSLVGDILQWNMKWLQEFQMVEEDPPLIAYKPLPIGNRFSDFKEYYFTMISLTVHEMWNELCRTHLFQTESQQFPLFSGIIELIEPNFDPRTMFSRIKILSPLSEAWTALPNFGDLVGIEILAPDHKRTHLYNTFGVVLRQYSRERLQPSRASNFLVNNLAPDKANLDKTVVCPIEVLFRASKTHKNNVSRDCFVRVRVYRNIMNQVKYFMALNKLSKSPLKSVVLDPTKTTSRVTEIRNDSKIYGEEHLPKLNSLQKAAVLGIAGSITSEDRSLSLIHGPPGTGKSSTIAALIVHLLHILRRNTHRRKGPTPKILLCAPSNTAIDELCVKLLDVRKKLRDEDKFRLTRVGNVKIMHPTVAEISSHNLAKRALLNTPDPESLETEMTLLAARMQAARNSLIGSNLKAEVQQKHKETIEKIETRFAFYSKTLANIRSGRPQTNPEEDRKLFAQEESHIISGAEIIATTLSSSVSKKISDALCDSNQFSCCVVDEATQATEPEVLIPLNHDIRHLVLVGDPLQLGPTVTSRFAKDKKFEWSLYHRLMAEWKQTGDAPLYPLREQYRMHAEIVSFPSQKFYNSELITPSFLEVNLPFTPYQVISHPWPESAGEESNEKEGKFIVELVQKLKNLQEFRPCDVGIIVPYQEQNRFIRRAIEDKGDRAFENVVVNTIDSFQGQEKDLIVLSCVRTKRIGFLSDRQRLNVALTRAKRCLLVVGNFQALKADEFWGAMIADAKSRNRFVETNPDDRIAPGLIFSKLFAGKGAKAPKRAYHRRT